MKQEEVSMLKNKTAQIYRVIWIYCLAYPAAIILFPFLARQLGLDAPIFNAALLSAPAFLFFIGPFLKTKRPVCLIFAGLIAFHSYWFAWGPGLQWDLIWIGFTLTDLFLIYLIWSQFQFMGGDLSIRYFRDIMEMAAMPLSGVTDGYTGRPYPAGKAEYTAEQLRGFANHLQYHFIATAYKSADGVKLAFSNGLFQYIPFLQPDWTKVTHMTFDLEGNYSVFIARKHYEGYIAELAFDQLCLSFGHVILDLLEDFKSGNKRKIVNKVRGREFFTGDYGPYKSPVLGWIRNYDLYRKKKNGVLVE